MARRGRLVGVPEEAADPVGLHPNVPVFMAPPLLSAKTADGAAVGTAPDAARVAADKVLAIPVLLMKCVFLWPESQNVVTRFIATYVLPVLLIVLCIGGIAFIAEGNYESGITTLTTFGDVFASYVILLKLLLLSREGPRLARIRRQLQSGFSAMEGLAEPEASTANTHCMGRCHTISMRFVYCYVPLCASAMGNVIVNALDHPEERRFTINTPRALLVCPYTYWPLLAINLMTTFTFFFYSVGYDSLFLSLCLHISCKCDILKMMLRRAGQRALSRPTPRAPAAPKQAPKAEAKQYRFEYWKDDGSALEAGSSNGLRDEVQENLKTCVRYHIMVIKLRDEMESIFAGVSLWQMAYILLGLGIPGLRLLRETTFKPADVMFLIFYAGWNFSQLLFYCWFADRLAASSGAVAEAAYAAMRPAEVGDGLREAAAPEDAVVVNLSKEAGTTLRLITMRAQKPLYLTAGNFANVTLELYLTIIRKSQSIYSYLIRMR